MGAAPNNTNVIKQCLLVDDHQDALALMTAYVKKAFPEASIIKTGSLAESEVAVKNYEFDLALVDLQLGDGCGCQLIKLLQKAQPHCLCVVSTMFDTDNKLITALESGAQGYLLKGQSPDCMVLQLQGIAQGLLPLSPTIARRLIGHFQANTKTQEFPGRLSPREQEVLGMLARGMRPKEIALELNISRFTVADYVKSIYLKLNVDNRAQAALAARSLKLV